MLHELEIQGFRCFPSLTAKPLGRVNLLVGKNNAGKTAFLDAVELVAWEGTPPIFRSLVRRKEYARKTYEESPGKLLTQFDIYPVNLFNGYRMQKETDVFVRSRHKGIFIRYVPRGLSAFGVEDAKLLVKLLPEDKKVSWSLGVDNTYRIATANLEEHRSKSATPVYFLSTDRADIHLLSKLWDEVLLTDDESLVSDALRLIEPSVDKVAARGEAEDRHFVIRLKGNKEPRRLGSLGDGMRHMLALALHLVPAQNGYLLIDEIDTGLHFSVMTKMWRMLIESAKRLNVQIFATTHSMDCIQALAEVHQQMKLTPEDLMLHRLVAGMDKTTCYTPDELVAVAEFQGEVR